MSQRSVTRKMFGTAVTGLVGLVVFAGLLVGTVNGYSDIAILAQNIGLALAVLVAFILLMLSLGRGS